MGICLCRFRRKTVGAHIVRPPSGAKPPRCRGDLCGRPSTGRAARPGGRALQGALLRNGRPHGAAPTAGNGPFGGSAGGASPSPTKESKHFRFPVGEPLGAPARIRTRSVGSAKPGAVLKAQQLKFLYTQAPVGRIELRKATQILRAGNIAKPDRYASPVMGSGGKRSYGHEVPVGRVPGGVLPTLPPWAK